MKNLRYLLYFIFFLVSLIALPNKIIIKVKPNLSISDIEHAFYGYKHIKKIQPFAKSKSQKSKINSYYKVTCSKDTSTTMIIDLLQKFSIVEEAFYCHDNTPLEIPNDANLTDTHHDGGQYFLQKHTFIDAWNVQKGNPEVRIGIVDTGIRLSHEDLHSKIYYNLNDPIDGTNNDQDSLTSFFGPLALTDNYVGWDVADWDNDPTPGSDAADHGTQVAGIAAASTNNGLGGVGAAYNCAFVPYKASPNNFPLSITHGYEGLVLAAEQGCQIINASWGTQKKYLPSSEVAFYQEIVNYIVNDLDAIIVAAAGNTDGPATEWIPAALDNVISVTAVKADFRKLNRSTYNSKVDFCAQGWKNITPYVIDDSSYREFTGTSCASPVVAGMLALMRSQFPSWKAKQITEQLFRTAYDIDTLPENVAFKGLMGKYPDPYRALTDTLPKVSHFDLTILSSGPYKSGNTIPMTFSLTNSNFPTEDLQVSVNNANLQVSELQNYDIGFLNRHDTVTELQFDYYLDKTEKDSTKITFLINYKDGIYTAVDTVSLYIPTPNITGTDDILLSEKSYYVQYPVEQDLIIHTPNDSRDYSYTIYDLLGNKKIQGKIEINSLPLKLNAIRSRVGTGLFILELKELNKRPVTLKFYVN